MSPSSQRPAQAQSVEPCRQEKISACGVSRRCRRTPQVKQVSQRVPLFCNSGGGRRRRVQRIIGDLDLGTGALVKRIADIGHQARFACGSREMCADSAVPDQVSQLRSPLERSRVHALSEASQYVHHQLAGQLRVRRNKVAKALLNLCQSGAVGGG